MANKKVAGWFTMNGKHIPMFEGESKDDAVKRAVKQDKPSKNSVVVVKKKEIDATDKNDADKLSKRNSDKKSVAEKNEDIKEKQIAQAKADADKASGKITRKDVEDLTAKKDALKGAKLNTKPISKEEVDAQKKTWGNDKSSGKEDLLFKIDWDKLPGTATANKEIQKYLNKNKIDWFTTKYFDTAADVDKTGDYYKIETKGGNVFVNRNKKYQKDVGIASSSKPSSLTVMKEVANQLTNAKKEAQKSKALEIQFTDHSGQTHKLWWDGARYQEKKPSSTSMSEKHGGYSGVYKTEFKKPKNW